MGDVQEVVDGIGDRFEVVLFSREAGGPEGPVGFGPAGLALRAFVVAAGALEAAVQGQSILLDVFAIEGHLLNDGFIGEEIEAEELVPNEVVL